MPVIDSRGTRPVVQSGDLAFLQQKEQEGKLKSARGTLSATGTLASITAGVNRDLYLASAQVIFYNNKLGGFSAVDTVELSFNGTVIETAKASLHHVASGGSTSVFSYEFKNISRKVSAGEIIKLEVTVLDLDTDVEGFIQCYEEPLGSQSFGGSTITINTGIPSENEITQVAQDYLPQTFTDTFSTKGATKLYITRDIREIIPTSTVTMSIIQGSASPVGSAGDKDTSTFTNMSDNTGSVDPIIRGDFGSLATRDIAILWQTAQNFTTTLQYRVNTDGDVTTPTTFTSFVTFHTGTIEPKQLFTVGSGLNFRHVEIKLITSSTFFVSARIFEVFDANEGWGDIDLDLQMFDDARSEWVSIPDQPTFIDLKSWNGDAKDTQEVDITMPNQSSQLRTVQVLNAKTNYSMQISKTDPTF